MGLLVSIIAFRVSIILSLMPQGKKFSVSKIGKPKNLA